MQISKRDYFAAAALTGLLAGTKGGLSERNYAAVSAEAYQYADEMLKLSKTLMDPVEIDPDQLSLEEENQQRAREQK